ncbi:MAG: response regulator transcription factor [Chitinophagaceae bacterium]|nr:MAG: response regulator transcription factor [Chitinophagaceae bacterium]
MKEATSMGLSKRELEIIGLITREFSNHEIADHLEISKRTVETHRKNIFKKTKAKTLVGLVIMAIRHKIVTP